MKARIMAKKTYGKIPAVLSVGLVMFGIGVYLSACGPQNSDLPPTPSLIVTTLPIQASPSLPKLVINNISLVVDELPGKPCPPPSERLKARVEIANRGPADAGAFAVEVNQTIQDVPTGLAAGKNLSLSFPLSAMETDISVKVTVKIFEGNESLNSLTQAFTLPSQFAECSQTPTPAVARQGPLFTLNGHTGEVLSVAFSPDGNLIASGSVDNTLRLWQTNTGKLIRTMQGHPFPILALQFSPNGSNLATGSTDSMIRLWQVADGRLLRNLNGHAGWVKGLDFSKDGKLLVSCGDDFTVRIWRLSDGKLMQTIDEGMTAITSVVFSPDNEKIAWSEIDGTVRLRTYSGLWLHIMKAESGAANSVVFSPQAKWLAVGYEDGSIRIWNVEDGSLLQILTGHTGAVSSLSFSPDSKWLVSGSKDGTLRLWRLNGELVEITPSLIYSGHTGPVNSVDFSPKGTFIASGSDDDTVRLWQVPEN